MRNNIARLRHAARLFREGASENQIKKLLADDHGCCYQHETDAVMLRLGSHARHMWTDWPVNPHNPHSKAVDYPEYIRWETDKDTLQLAVLLHGPRRIQEKLGPFGYETLWQIPYRKMMDDFVHGRHQPTQYRVDWEFMVLRRCRKQDLPLLLTCEWLFFRRQLEARLKGE